MKIFSVLILAFIVCAISVFSFFHYQKNKPLSVSEVFLNQNAYHEKQVKVKGRVKEVMSVVGKGGYSLTDGENTILVVFGSGGSPDKGTVITATGKFVEGYNVFGKRQGAILESYREPN